nr:hypothetical protein StreXyl84_50230 [Streptomyces sp. Xyl84]
MRGVGGLPAGPPEGAGLAGAEEGGGRRTPAVMRRCRAGTPLGRSAATRTSSFRRRALTQCVAMATKREEAVPPV